MPLSVCFRNITSYEREYIRNQTRLMFNCKFYQMPAEITTTWSHDLPPASHRNYSNCLRKHNGHDRYKHHCHKPLRSRCVGPVEQSLQNQCHIYMERTRLATRGEIVDDMEGFPPIASYLNCSHQSRVAAKACLPQLVEKCKQKPIKVTKLLRGNMTVMSDILMDFPGLKVVHLLRDPRAIINSRLALHWKWWGGPLNISKEARLLCIKMREDIRQRQELEERYPGLTMEFVYEDIAQNPMTYIPALYSFTGIPMPNSTKYFIQQITSKSGNIATQWRTKLSKGTKEKIDNECEDLYKITNYRP